MPASSVTCWRRLIRWKIRISITGVDNVGVTYVYLLCTLSLCAVCYLSLWWMVVCINICSVRSWTQLSDSRAQKAADSAWRKFCFSTSDWRCVQQHAGHAVSFTFTRALLLCYGRGTCCGPLGLVISWQMCQYLYPWPQTQGQGENVKETFR